LISSFFLFHFHFPFNRHNYTFKDQNENETKTRKEKSNQKQEMKKSDRLRRHLLARSQETSRIAHLHLCMHQLFFSEKGEEGFRSGIVGFGKSIFVEICDFSFNRIENLIDNLRNLNKADRLSKFAKFVKIMEPRAFNLIWVSVFDVCQVSKT